MISTIETRAGTGNGHGDNFSCSEDSASLVPMWKDDGDDSSSIEAESNELFRIPSVLEFSREEEEDSRPSSPSNMSFHTEIIADDLHSLHSRMGSDISEVPRDNNRMTSLEQLNHFRRRLHSSVDSAIDADMAASVTESPQLSTRSQSQSSPGSSSLRRYNPFGRANSRFIMTIGALVFVFFSVHENIQTSRRNYPLPSRREEVAFPFVEVRVRSDATEARTSYTHQEQEKEHASKHKEYQQQQPEKAELRKYHLPKIESRSNAFLRGGYANNLSMARAQQQARPVFVPDASLSADGLQKPRERFVFHDSQQRRSRRERESSTSWTMSVTGLVLFTVLFDTGWKEYRRRSRGSTPSSRDE